MEGKLYLDDTGHVMWVPDDPTNYEYKLAQTGWYAEVDPQTGEPLPGEVERAAAVRQAQIDAELAAQEDDPEQLERSVPDDPEALHQLGEQMAGRPLVGG